MAENEGRIDLSWRIGKNLGFHSNEASRIEVSLDGLGLMVWYGMVMDGLGLARP